MDKKLFILDVVGSCLSSLAVLLLMLVTVYLPIQYLVLVLILFYFVLSFFLDFVGNVIWYLKRRRVKRYSLSIIPSMKASVIK